jgi:Ca-activated chloride channel family protein
MNGIRKKLIATISLAVTAFMLLSFGCASPPQGNVLAVRASRTYDELDNDTSSEEYNSIDEIGFRSPLKNPFSTFSANVDSASYSNMRRYINQGQIVPVDAIRTEELVNYFHYDYPRPEGKDMFAVSAEYAACPWNGAHNLMLIGIQAKELDKEEYPPSNLVFLLDVSGSMSDSNKLPLVQEAFRLLTERLGEEDVISIVTYAGSERVVLNGVSGRDKTKILNAINNLGAGGSTAGASGITTAYRIAEENFIQGGNNRVILATDGDFNVGISSNNELIRLIEKKRDSGVFLSTMGFGYGNLKDNKLEDLAKNGNGNYYYIDNELQARKVLVEELSGTLYTIAKDVKLQIEFNPAKVKGYRLIGYEHRMLSDEDFKDDSKDAGEVGAGHRVTALIEIIPAGSDEEVRGADSKYQTTTVKPSDEVLSVGIRYKLPDGNESMQLSFPVKDDILTTAPSANFRFASAVAEFGLLLRGSEYKGSAIFDSVLARVREAADDEYKQEFVSLVKKAKGIYKEKQ